MYKNVLIIAPHADDEILGCGGIISKLVKKKINVYVAIMTNASKGDSKLFSINKIKIIRKEAEKANKILGVKKLFFYNFPAPKLDQYPSYKISIQIKKLLDQLKIDTLFVPFEGDIHTDHKIIFQASMVASRPIGENKIKNIYSYEVLSETEWGYQSFKPNYYVKITKNEILDKIKAFGMYKSQNKNNFHPRSKNGIINLAKTRGNNISNEFAEAFKIIRIIS